MSSRILRARPNRRGRLILERIFDRPHLCRPQGPARGPKQELAAPACRSAQTGVNGEALTSAPSLQSEDAG